MSNFRCSKKSPDSSASSSSSCCLARTLKTKRGKNLLHPATWSMSSVLTTLPESLPPSYATAYVDNATDFSTPRNQRLGTAYIGNNCFSEIDEWLEHANKFCKSYHTDDHFTETRGNGSPGQQVMGMSEACNHFLLRAHQEHQQLYNIILPSVREQSPVPQNITSCINIYGGGSSNQHTKLMSRPKPYDQFLNETIRKKQEADKDVRNKAKHLQLMHRLRRKEEAINDWELHQTMKAMDHMDKIQNKLERKQVLASARTQMKICSVREKAEKQKLKLRRSTTKMFQQLQIHDETHSPSDSSRDSGLHFC